MLDAKELVSLLIEESSLHVDPVNKANETPLFQSLQKRSLPYKNDSLYHHLLHRRMHIAQSLLNMTGTEKRKREESIKTNFL
jgi:hypothetical protein